MPCDHTGNVTLSPLAGMLSVDTADVAAADRGRLRLDQNLPVAGLRDVIFLQFHGGITGQDRASHFYHNTLLLSGIFDT